MGIKLFFEEDENEIVFILCEDRIWAWSSTKHFFTGYVPANLKKIEMYDYQKGNEKNLWEIRVNYEMSNDDW